MKLLRKIKNLSIILILLVLSSYIHAQDAYYRKPRIVIAPVKINRFQLSEGDKQSAYASFQKAILESRLFNVVERKKVSKFLEIFEMSKLGLADVKKMEEFKGYLYAEYILAVECIKLDFQLTSVVGKWKYQLIGIDNLKPILEETISSTNTGRNPLAARRNLTKEIGEKIINDLSYKRLLRTIILKKSGNELFLNIRKDCGIVKHDYYKMFNPDGKSFLGYIRLSKLMEGYSIYSIKSLKEELKPGSFIFLKRIGTTFMKYKLYSSYYYGYYNFLIQEKIKSKWIAYESILSGLSMYINDFSISIENEYPLNTKANILFFNFLIGNDFDITKNIFFLVPRMGFTYTYAKYKVKNIENYFDDRSYNDYYTGESDLSFKYFLLTANLDFLFVFPSIPIEFFIKNNLRIGLGEPAWRGKSKTYYKISSDPFTGSYGVSAGINIRF